tara:strand:+ start:111 stop:389 length:279 start_codon:yes stop_codon:yes gene_type:complete
MTNVEMNKLADLIVKKITDQQAISDEKFKLDLEELANAHPDLKLGTKSQEDLVYEELDNLTQDLKHCESIEDYAAASKLLITIEKFKKKYNL